MELLNDEEVNNIIKQYGNLKVLDYTISKYSDLFIGSLGDHFKLIVTVDDNGVQDKYNFFVKTMPNNQWVAEYLRKSNYFRREYTMLRDLFAEFDRNGGSKWRPRCIFVKEDVFVFEDAKELGYQMAGEGQGGILSHKQMLAAVTTLARFHARSFIYEEKKSLELKRSYRIWEDFSELLHQPPDHSWRNTGRNAVIEFLKVHSKRKNEPDFSKNVTELLTSLFDDALEFIKPSTKYRNTVIHRDLWCNNILIKSDNEQCHALIVDFQTVLYGVPTLDLSSLIYFNTTKEFRDKFHDEMLDIYYEELSHEVGRELNIDFSTIVSKATFLGSYEECVIFGMIQAAILVPITAMKVERKNELYRTPESGHRINNVSRSKEIIEAANEDAAYCSRITELFEEIVDKYYIPC
ncbi:uncharacterized protein LOC125230068 [Leguminivora glycinivorella]|uniref:uncharacterized protein LOC125230068 n=1 Tax=Leguminivora glycinivorella TaxID=1035111 RepID=UPI00200D58A1|nr:uncharacterized protein LOC125230068 [Leguminivora glycinivorella]